MTAAKKKFTTFKGVEVTITDRQEKFARLYASTGNAAKSRIEAGYKPGNSSRNAVEAYKLMQNPDIAAVHEHYQHEISKKIDINENRILAEIASIAFCNIANMFEGGKIKDISDVPVSVQRAVKSIKVHVPQGKDVTHSVVNIEMHDKLKALQQIAEIKGINKTQQQDINVTVNIDGKEKT